MKSNLDLTHMYSVYSCPGTNLTGDSDLRHASNKKWNQRVSTSIPLLVHRGLESVLRSQSYDVIPILIAGLGIHPIERSCRGTLLVVIVDDVLLATE